MNYINLKNFFQAEVTIIISSKIKSCIDIDWSFWILIDNFFFPLPFLFFFVVSDAAAAVINCLILLNASCKHRSIFAPLSPSGSVSGGIVRTALILEREE